MGKVDSVEASEQGQLWALDCALSHELRPFREIALDIEHVTSGGLSAGGGAPLTGSNGSLSQPATGVLSEAQNNSRRTFSISVGAFQALHTLVNDWHFLCFSC